MDIMDFLAVCPHRKGEVKLFTTHSVGFQGHQVQQEEEKQYTVCGPTHTASYKKNF